MKVIKIEIKLTDQAVGTEAIVTTKRFLREPELDFFLCYRADPIMGGLWIDNNGMEPNSELLNKLNLAAHAKANITKANRK